MMIPTNNPTKEFVSIRLAEMLVDGEINIEDFEDELPQLARIIIASLDHKPFPVVTVHDEFKCHPNYMNHLRAHYVSMFQELAHSELLSDILSQIHGKTYHVPKFGNVVEKIGKANYALS
jgi:hypothetical protein